MLEAFRAILGDEHAEQAARDTLMSVVGHIADAVENRLFLRRLQIAPTLVSSLTSDDRKAMRAYMVLAVILEPDDEDFEQLLLGKKMTNKNRFCVKNVIKIHRKSS